MRSPQLILLLPQVMTRISSRSDPATVTVDSEHAAAWRRV